MFEHVIDLIRVLVWPVVVVLTLVLFRKSIPRFVEGIARRTTRVSAFQFSIELATLSEFKPSWTAPNLSDLRQPTPAAEFSSAASALFDQIAAPGASDYALIDLGANGDQWLTSRLFIFAEVLRRVRALRCLVFVETTASARRHFIGVASPEPACSALAVRYPWLEEALAKAYAAATAGRIVPTYDALDPGVATQIAQKYLEEIQVNAEPVGPDANEWVRLQQGGGPPTAWEHAKWLDGARLERVLGPEVLRHAASPELLDSPPAERVRAVLRRRGTYVALVDDDNVFRALVDRGELLEQTARQLASDLA